MATVEVIGVASVGVTGDAAVLVTFGVPTGKVAGAGAGSVVAGAGRLGIGAHAASKVARINRTVRA
jgi:hypothetical protein